METQKIVITKYPAGERGHVDHGWLKAKHSFSFGSWFNEDRIHFGALRVLNDDTVAPGMGFGTHPHDNMEIVTIPLSGTVRHRDNMGNEGNITPGEIQIMSAGTGVTHSEFNPNRDQELKLFQIWIIPNKRNVPPRYQQLDINAKDKKNEWVQLVSPDPNDEGGWIHQEAWFNFIDMNEGDSNSFKLKRPETHGVYIMDISGKFEVENENLNDRDALSATGATELSINALSSGSLLAIEVPLKF